jgi:hypothetical protein
VYLTQSVKASELHESSLTPNPEQYLEVTLDNRIAINILLAEALRTNINQVTREESISVFNAGARRSFAAIFTRSGRESAFIFRITLPR